MVTTVLELCGAVLLIVALALFLATWNIPAAIAAAGAALIALSALITWRAKR